jgi:glycosyltransferase involved in cell wall biosynthesis
VVIPSHNGAKYVSAAIDSALRQTIPPAEIIVVDDCSRDQTVRIVTDLAPGAGIPIRVLRLPRNSGGPAHPINVGAEAAASELIAVLEQDDLMAPTRIARSLEAAGAFPTAGLICGRVRITSSEAPPRDDLWGDGHRQFDDLPLTPVTDTVFRAEPRDVIASLLSRNIVFTNSNAVFPRSIWQRVGGFDRSYRICTDLDFNLKVARLAPFAVIDEFLCDHYLHDDSLYESNRAVGRGHSPANFEAGLIRLRHALHTYAPASDAGRQWYRQAWRMLGSACRNFQWRRTRRVLSVLSSPRALRHHVADPRRWVGRSS